jgi:hypothetical protein
MLLVGGGMFTHNLHALHRAAEVLPAVLLNLLIGAVVGTVLVLSHMLVSKVRS